jgi:hypothetical protein
MVVGFKLYGNAQAADAVTGHANGPPSWLVAIAAALIIAGLMVAVLRAGWWGITLVLAIVACYVALLLTPWPGGPHAIFDRLHHDYPATTLVVTFVVLCAVLSLVQRFGWRAYKKTGIPQRQARKLTKRLMDTLPGGGAS